MGQIQTKIALSNPRKAELDPLEVEALVNTGVATLCIPEHVATQLNLEVLEQREITTAHGNKYKCDYVGPVQIRFGNRSCFSGALVLGDSVLLGAIPMDDMDLVIHPRDRKVSVNPESPNIPSAIVKKNTPPPAKNQTGTGAAVELRYFETSAVNWLEKHLSIGDAIATRPFQEVRGRAWVLSPVVLWEILLTQNILRREKLIYFCQRLFHRNLLKSPEEVLIGYIERGCPAFEKPRSMRSASDMATVWRDLCECPDKTIVINHEELRERTSAVQSIVRDVHRITKEEKVNLIKYGTGRPMDFLLEEALAQMPSMSGGPAISRENRILIKIAIFYALILLCAEVGTDPVPTKAYWSRIGIHAIADRLFYLLRHHEACVTQGPLAAMALMTKTQCERKYSRGVYFDSLHASYLTFVHQFFAEDSHFDAFRDVPYHTHGKKIHRLSNARWMYYSGRVNPEYSLLKRV